MIIERDASAARLAVALSLGLLITTGASIALLLNVAGYW